MKEQSLADALTGKLMDCVKVANTFATCSTCNKSFPAGTTVCPRCSDKERRMAAQAKRERKAQRRLQALA